MTVKLIFIQDFSLLYEYVKFYSCVNNFVFNDHGARPPLRENLNV